MDEKPDQILGHIEAQRNELGRNLNELETRVRRGTDWKTYFDRNPMMMLGVALGGGLLLGTAVGKRGHSGSSRGYSRGTASALGFASAGATGSYAASSPRSSSSVASSPVSSSPMMAAQRQQISETMEHIKAALIGFGIAKAKEFMSQAIPGFDHHLTEAEQKHRQQQSQSGGFSAESGSGRSANQGSWESDAYASGGRDNSGTYGNTSGGQTGYRGNYSPGEEVGAGTGQNVKP